jgi:tripeptide aminopeptidase
MINKERAINTFFEYVKINSETGNEKNMSQRLAEDLRKLGFKVHVDNAGEKCQSNGNNVYCFVEGTFDAEPLLFSAHMDTVKPGVGIEPYIDGKYIRSKTDTILGADDKSGVAAIMEALRVVKEKNLPHRPLEIVFTISEEKGLLGAKNLEFDRLKAKNAIVIDSSGNAGDIKIQAPGKKHVIMEVAGIASHAGACPEKGISSIMVASEAIANMKLLRIDEETTANIGSFIAPGPNNIVCSHAEITAEIRSMSSDKLDDQLHHMMECFEKASKRHGAQITSEVVTDYEPYRLDDNIDIVNLIKKKCRDFGIGTSVFADGGGSDANIYNKNGINAVAIGTGMDFVHTTKEQLFIDDFIKTIEVLVAVMDIQ